MIRLPKAARGGMKYESLTATIDILPTLTNYLELPTPVGVEGEPLDLLNLTANHQRILFSEGTKPWKDVETDPRWFNIRKARCALKGSFKYIQTQYLGTEELYDLSKDPREKYNLLARAFSQWLVLGELDKGFRDWVAAAKPLPSRFEPSQQEETKRRLKSLGYL
jgi:arylsulfatase A-like enzyme